MGRRQVSGQQNVSYSTGTRRETWSHVTTGKLTVAYAAQTVSNFGANREFRTSICLGDTGGKLAGASERISSLDVSSTIRLLQNLDVVYNKNLTLEDSLPRSKLKCSKLSV
ncbi:hypothetical protein ANTPLA_LOCUS7571 [Anthophora plagiata]